MIPRMTDDLVFRALADPSRRTLLDLLFQENGQSLGSLSAHLDMTRFGCMKHLRVLEEAGLVVARKSGREKLHYINPVPIQQVYERWVTKYSRRWTRALTQLKHAVEDGNMSTEKHTHVFEILIRTTPEKLWQAITDGTFTEQYYYGTRVTSTWTKGAMIHYQRPDGGSMLDGEILEIDPPRRLVTTFVPLWDDEAKAAPRSRVTYEIEAMGPVCKLTLIHDDLVAGAALTRGVKSGWSVILSSLKTLLETGQALPVEV